MGLNFSNVAFRRFASDYGFEHATSSPRYPRGNGLAERTVQTIKGILQKSAFSGEDLYLGLLAFRTTPHETTGVSPAQMLMGRRLRSRLPARTSQLEPALVDTERAKEADAANKLKQASYYNRHNGVRTSQSLKPGDKVLV